MGAILLSHVAYTKDLQFICITCVTHAEASKRCVMYLVADSKQDLLFSWYQDSAELPYLLGSETQLFLISKGNDRAGVSIRKH